MKPTFLALSWRQRAEMSSLKGWAVLSVLLLLPLALAIPHRHRRASTAVVAAACAPGCEINGNCNRALGQCECPVGWTGANCSEAVWPSCRVSPKQLEVYCAGYSDWVPRSCACLEQCAAFVCPTGKQESCEREFDLHNSKCFLRSNVSSIVTDGVAWDGGSDLPDDTEEGVLYYQGWLQKDARREITRQEVTEVGIIEDVDAVSSLIAQPIASCPLRCSLRGSCVRRQQEVLPFCACHYGWSGEFCEERVEWTGAQNVCYNRCSGRGTCRRGFCHCQPGWWGQDCSSSQVFAPHSARRAVHRLRVYVYDLPWMVSYQPEYALGWRDHDQNYLAYRLFIQRLLKDNVTRTHNPWEANLFAIPAEVYAFSENTGNPVPHSKRAIDWVRQNYPFFNRSQGLDHVIWMPGDRGACDVPAEEEPEVANVIKVVHFGYHHRSAGGNKPSSAGAGSAGGGQKGLDGDIKNKHWGCFNPLRDIVAAAYWRGQADTANKTYIQQSFDTKHLPTTRLLFFSGSIRPNDTEYSHGVRQQLWRMFGDGSNQQVLIHDGAMHPDMYARMLNSSRFCLAPSGYGWGIRLNTYVLAGCVPVIIQDDVYQPYEDLLPYFEFSVRLPRSAIPDIVQLLSQISDAEYRQLRQGLLKHWRAFAWHEEVGGQAYDHMIRSLKDRMLRLQARHYHPVHSRPLHHAAPQQAAAPSAAQAGSVQAVTPQLEGAAAVPATT